MPGDSGRAPARAIERAFTREHSLACETVFTSQRLSSGSLSPPCQPVPLGSISPNPRCWYRETRWSASNQRQDPSSSSASSYSRGRLKFEGEAEVRRGYSLSLPLSFSFTHSLNHSSSFSLSLSISLPSSCSLTRSSRRHLSRAASVGDSTTLIPDSGFTCGNPNFV